MSSPAVKIALGKAPRFFILLSVQFVALTRPLLRKESPAITPEELISKAALDEPPESIPRFTMPPLEGHCTATKFVAGCPFMLEYPTIVPESLMPIAPLTVAPASGQ